MFRPPIVAIFREVFCEGILRRTVQQSGCIKCSVSGNGSQSMLQYKTLIQLRFEYVHNRWPKHAEGYTNYNTIQHLPHVKIFSLDFPNCFSVDVHLLCYAPVSQPAIFTQNLTKFCNVLFSSACCWPSRSLFVSDTFSSLRKTFHPLVNCYFLHSIIPH